MCLRNTWEKTKSTNYIKFLDKQKTSMYSNFIIPRLVHELKARHVTETTKLGSILSYSNNIKQYK